MQSVLVLAGIWWWKKRWARVLVQGSDHWWTWNWQNKHH